MSTEQVMKALNATFPPSPKEALPVVTFDDDVTLHLNGDTLHIFHVANAHTDGDAFIHWQNANIIHMGDTFPNSGLPFIDRGSGGSIDGLIAAMETALKVVNDQTKIITGHGPVASRQDLVRYRDMLVEIRGKVAAGIKSGQTLDQIKASAPAAKYATPGGFIQPDGFVEGVYESLRNPPAHGHTH
jgi:glyoxylase-like metal-dependent hydrolase (beta-lactamase superfamily II)